MNPKIFKGLKTLDEISKEGLHYTGERIEEFYIFRDENRVIYYAEKHRNKDERIGFNFVFGYKKNGK